MCTAISFKGVSNYFGRNLDFEYSFNEKVIVTPRNFQFRFSKEEHYAIIGMGVESENYPLYFDAANEKGVCMAGLNFPDNCVYQKEKEGCKNIPSYDFISYILASCKDMNEVRKILKNINITDTPFSENLPPSPLHWIISFKGESVVVESVKEGIKIYENPIGVLTNNPPFGYHISNLSNYMNLSAAPPQNRFAPDTHIEAYSRGMGAMGLPGDLSSSSRFIRAAFMKLNSPCEDNEPSAVAQFFHILDCVKQIKGANRLENNEYEITLYSSCINADRGVYYYKTYQNPTVNAVDMNKVELSGKTLKTFPLEDKMQIKFQN